MRTGLVHYLVMGLVLAGFLASIAFEVQRVPAGMIGVKETEESVLPTEYGPGLYFTLRGKARWHFVDPAEHPLKTELEIRTIENVTALFDVTASYRVRPGEVHELVGELDPGDCADRVERILESVAREELARYPSTEIWAREARERAAARLATTLADELERLHLDVGSVGVPAVRFEHPVEGKREHMDSETEEIERDKTAMGRGN